ncbi:MAG TPA: hypothetical protein ENH94_02850 [Phycisphaerales bacterium]|nr:hypothetical protein [Phycisphaerales bacterium]
MESKKHYNKKFFLGIAVFVGVLQLFYLSSSNHMAKAVADSQQGAVQSASIGIELAAFVSDMIAEPVSAPIDFGNCPQVQAELPGDTSGEIKDDLAEAVKTQQGQLDLLKKENERLGKDIEELSNCLDAQQKNNISLEKRVKELEKLKAKFAKKILGL